MHELGSPIRSKFRDLVERVHRSYDLRASRHRVFLVHGMGEHGGRYEEFADRLMRFGCEVHLMDLRGHGLSGGIRMHVDRFERLVDDLADFIDEIHAGSDREFVLVGHSLGSVLAGHYVLRHPKGVRGLALLGAPFGAEQNLSWIQRKLGPTAARIVPRWRVAPPFGPEALSNDASVPRAFVADRLCQDRCTLRFGAETLRGILELAERAPKIRVPTLVLHGADDRVAPVGPVRKFHERLGTSEKRLHVFENALHELHHELPEVRERFYFELQQWFESLP